MKTINKELRLRPAAELLRLKTLYEQDFQGWGFNYNYPRSIKRWLRRIRKDYLKVINKYKFRMFQDIVMLANHEYNFADLFRLNLDEDYIELLTYCLIFVVEVSEPRPRITLENIFSFQFKPPAMDQIIVSTHVCIAVLDRPKTDVVHVKATISAWLSAGNMDSTKPQLDLAALLDSLYGGAVNKAAAFGKDVLEKMMRDFTAPIMSTINDYCQIVGPMFAYIYLLATVPKIVKWHTLQDEQLEKPSVVEYVSVSVCIGYLIMSEESLTAPTVLVYTIRRLLTEPTPQIDIIDPLVTLLQGWVLTKHGVNLDLATLRTISQLGMSRKGLVDMVESVLHLIQEIGNIIMDKMGYKYHFRSRATGYGELDSYMKDVDQVLSEWNQGLLIFEPANANRIQLLQSRGSELLKSTAMRSLSSAYTNLVLENNRKLNDISVKFDQANVWHTGLRFETICLMFSAPPKRHKSLHGKVWIDLCVNLCSTKEEREMHRKSDRTFVFNRQPENVYWDAFTTLTKVVFCDDYGQVRVSSSNPSGDGESMGMIRMMNVFPMNMHCAKVESKGLLQNHAKFCIATTNLKCLKGEDIVSAEALRRRVNMYHCTFKPKFLKIDLKKTQNGKINRDYWNEEVDWVKLSRHCKLAPGPERDIVEKDIIEIDPEVWEYHKVDPKTGKIDDVPYSFNDLKKIVQELYLEHLGHYLNNQRVFTNFNRKLEKELHDDGYFDRVSKMTDRIRSDRLEVTSSSQDIVPQSGIKESIRDILFGWSDPTNYEDSLDMVQLDGDVVNLYNSRNNSIVDSSLSDIDLSDFKFELKPAGVKIHRDWTISSFIKHIYDKFGINLTSDPESLIIEKSLILSIDELLLFFKRVRLSISISHAIDASQLNILSNVLVFNVDMMLREFDINDFNSDDVARYMVASIVSTYRKHPLFVRWLSASSETTVIPIPNIRCVPKEPFTLMYDSFRDIISSVVDKGSSFVRTAYAFSTDLNLLKENKLIVFIGGLGAIVAIASKVMGVDDDLVPQSFDKITVPKKAPKSNLRKISDWKSREPQILDKQASDLCTSLYRTNTIEMCIENENNRSIVGHIVGLKGHIAMMNYHYIQYFWSIFDEQPQFGDVSIEFRQQGKLLLKTDVKNFLSWFTTDDHSDPDRDVVLFKFPITMRLFKDITGKFAPRSIFDKVTQCRVYNMSGKRDCKDLVLANIKMEENTAIKVNQEGEFYIIKDRISYDLSTIPGDCGSLIIAASPHFGSRKVLGIHSAGGKGEGYGSVITYEVLLELMSGLETDVLSPQIENIVFEEPSTLYEKHICVGITEMHHKIGLSHTHIPSSLQQVREPTTGNSVLVTTDGVSPLKKALDKFSKENVSQAWTKDQAMSLNYASESYTMLLKKMIIPDHGKRLLTIEECLWGNPEYEFISSLNSSSSAGCYFKKYHPKLKDQLFKEGVLRSSNNPAFAEIMCLVNEWESMMDNGVVPPDFYTFNLKDELLPLEKIEQKKSRGFMGGSLISMVMFAKYFGAFRSTFLANRITNESSLGINVFSYEWTKLAEYMTKHKREGIPYLNDGDYSGYDTSHLKSLMWEVFILINVWYDDEHTDKRRLLWRTLVDAHFVHSNVVLSLAIGMCSGNYMTSVINTMINSLLFRYAFCRYLQIEGFEEEEFTDHVSLSVHGDDNIWNTAIEGFDGEFVAKSVSELGYSLTSAQKDGTVSTWKRLEDVEYLKRSFKYEPTMGLYIAPLRLSVVEEIPLWTNKKLPEEVFKTNIEVSLREASLHDRITFNSYRDKLIQDLMECSPDHVQYVTSRSRVSILREVYAQEDIESMIKVTEDITSGLSDTSL